MTQWQPPPDFQEVDSHLDGFRVFAPAPQDDEQVDTQRTYRCPNCGGPTQFVVAVGAVKCDYCEWTDTAASDRRVGRRAEAHEFTMEALAAAEHGWGVQRRELDCESCGAALALDEGGLSATCPFCASNRVRIREVQDVGLRPRFIVPFKIVRKTLAEPVKKWLSAGWIHPGRLHKLANVDDFVGIYLPFWTFSADFSADWKAEVGRTETYTTWEDGRRVTKTRTVWRWENGHVDTHLENWDTAGTDKLSRRLLDKLRPWNFDDFVEFSPDFLAGWQAQTYDTGLLEAWDIGKHDMRDHVRQICRGRCSTSKVRNFSMVCDLDDEKWRYVLLPVWVSVYKFQKKTWRVLVNGQTGEVVGQKPVAWWKIWLAICAMFTPGLFTLFISIPLLLLGVGLVTLIFGLVFSLLPIPFAMALYRRGTESELA